MTDNRYFLDLASAFVRGTAVQTGSPSLDARFQDEPLESLSDVDKQAIIDAGSGYGLKLYRFKRGHVDMPRVRRTLGILQGIMPQSILDIGSGRGAFLWPCLDAFPDTPVTAIDVEEKRIELYETVRRGGLERLQGVRCDIQAPDPEFLERKFDVVTLLEVMEHLPDPEAALRNVVHLAMRHIVISVPSKEDDNPSHIHLFSEKSFTKIFERIDGIKRYRFDYVPGHLFAFLTLQS